jgi:hypothetical protein
MDFTKQHGQTLAQEVGRVLQTKLRPVNGPLTIAFEKTFLPLQSKLSVEDLKKIVADKRHPQAFAANQMLALLGQGKKIPAYYSPPFTVWQLGKDLTIVGLPGEVVVDYLIGLEKALGPINLWVAGYCNDVFGYLPSAKVLSEGGYETRGLYAAGPGLFDPAVEAAVINHVRSLAQKAGRKIPE